MKSESNIAHRGSYGVMGDRHATVEAALAAVPRLVNRDDGSAATSLAVGEWLARSDGLHARG